MDVVPWDWIWYGYLQAKQVPCQTWELVIIGSFFWGEPTVCGPFSIPLLSVTTTPPYRSKIPVSFQLVFLR